MLLAWLLFFEFVWWDSHHLYKRCPNNISALKGRSYNSLIQIRKYLKVEINEWLSNNSKWPSSFACHSSDMLLQDSCSSHEHWFIPTINYCLSLHKTNWDTSSTSRQFLLWRKWLAPLEVQLLSQDTSQCTPVHVYWEVSLCWGIHGKCILWNFFDLRCDSVTIVDSIFK